MGRPSRREVLGGIAAASLLPRLPRAGGRRGRTNVLFVMTDQHHWRALSCSGNPEIATPGLDHLAAGGTRFTTALSASGQCAPSRYSIWTGLHVRGHRLLRNGLRGDVSRRTVGELFRDAGYRTATFGKTHVPPEDVGPEHGFDLVVDRPELEAFVTERRGIRRANLDRPTYLFPGRKMLAGTSPYGNELSESAFWVDRAIELLREEDERPFCAWVSFYGPHPPVLPSEPWASQYDPERLSLPPNHRTGFDERVPGLAALREEQGLVTRQQRELLALYYGYVSQIDHNVGRLLQSLEECGRAGDTLVVFTSDHGDMMGEHGVWTKGYHGYDATLRVPLLVRLPGTVPAGEVREDLVSSVDLLPTLLALSGLDAPDGLVGRPLFDPALGARDAAFAETGVEGQVRATVCRTPAAKHVRFSKHQELVYEQYFDLALDPWETTNRIEEARADGRLAPLLERHLAWLADASGREPA